jgi:hypothetical protein
MVPYPASASTRPGRHPARFVVLTRCGAGDTVMPRMARRTAGEIPQISYLAQIPARLLQAHAGHDILVS